MTRRFVFACSVSLFTLLSGLTGCSPQTAPGPASPAASTGGHAGGDETEGGGEKAIIEAALGNLSEADAATARAQQHCPVGGELLGTMGTPQKVDVNGQQVWICCEGCQDRLQSNPDKYLYNLKRE